MKTGAIVRIVIFSILILLFIGLLVIGLGLDLLTANPHAELMTAGEKLTGVASLPAGKVRELEIDWVSGSVLIQTADTDQISFSENADLAKKNRLVWSLSSSGKLTLQFSEAKISIGTTVRISKDLVVTVPKDWHCEDLAIRSVSAGVQVSGLDAREMELDNVSGKCRFLDCTSEDFNAVTVSGTVAYQGTGSAIRFNTVSGSCTLEAASCPKQVELDGVSGNLTVVLPADCGYTADLDTLSGKMLLGERTYGKGTQVSGDGACSITADTVSGDLSIQLAAK